MMKALLFIAEINNKKIVLYYITKKNVSAREIIWLKQKFIFEKHNKFMPLFFMVEESDRRHKLYQQARKWIRMEKEASWERKGKSKRCIRDCCSMILMYLSSLTRPHSFCVCVIKHVIDHKNMSREEQSAKMEWRMNEEGVY